MPDIGAVIGAVVKAIPGIGVLIDVPAFRDPGPGQYTPSQRPSSTPTPQTRGPRLQEPPRVTARPPQVSNTSSKPFVHVPSHRDYAAMGINEGLELAALPLEPIPYPGEPMPPMVSKTASDLEKKKCWEKTVAHSIIGAGGGLAGGIASAEVGCVLVPGAWRVACKIGAYLLGLVGGGTAVGMNAHADNCLTEAAQE